MPAKRVRVKGPLVGLYLDRELGVLTNAARAATIAPVVKPRVNPSVPAPAMLTAAMLDATAAVPLEKSSLQVKQPVGTR